MLAINVGDEESKFELLAREGGDAMPKPAMVDLNTLLSIGHKPRNLRASFQ
jgi:hypothetical protein